MADIKVTIKNAIHLHVEADRGILQEISDYFTFRPKNYQHHPKYRNRIWDGYIRIFSTKDQSLYVGLINLLKKFADEREYTIDIHKDVFYGDAVTEEDITNLATKLKIPYTLHDYQAKYITDAIKDGRSLNLSPTSSGKSLIQYIIAMFYIINYDVRVLIVVPRIQLTKQMVSDFVSYNCPREFIGMMGDGVNDDPGTKIVVSTWHTLVKKDSKFFSEFGCVLGDEAHTFDSKSLTTIMDSLPECYFRHGFTGTISSESKVHRLNLEGMFGKIRKYISTKEMIDNNVTAKFKIKAILLNHTKDEKKRFREALKQLENDNKIHNSKKGKMKYPLEKAFLKASDSRNEFIKNLVASLDGKNNLILFDDVDTHGKILAEMFEREGRVVFFIHGKVDVDVREEMRQQIESNPEKVYDIVASSGTTSTGVSIKRIDNAIFASGTKGEVKTLQSIGRLLRKGNGSDDTVLYDIGDLLTSSTNNGNYSYQHFAKRLEIYAEEGFEVKVYTVDL